MSNEKLIPRPITPIKQSYEASCVVASITMVLNGFGLDIAEQMLVDKYFPSAKLPAGDLSAGVTNTNAIKGMVQILKDLGLKHSLQIDVFDPHLYAYTRSPKDRYIVRAQPQALNKYGKNFEKDSDLRGFYDTLGRLLKTGELGVYTANNRLLEVDVKHPMYRYDICAPEGITRRAFYAELEEFIRKGHIVGPHGGMTCHARVLDGTSRIEIPWRHKKKEVGFWMVDPRGEIYEAAIDNLIWLNSHRVSGDTFDYLFRISPKEEVLNPRQHGFLGFIRKLRNLNRGNNQTYHDRV